MNASATALTREDEVQSRIRKIRTFGRNAHGVCRALFVFGLVVSVVMLLIVALGGPTGQITTLQLKVGVFLVVGMVVGVWLAAMYQLYRLFGNLAVGTIYTPENVRRVRNVGLLWLLWVVLGFLIPVVSTSLVRSGFIDAWGPFKHQPVFPSEWLSSIIAAGLVLLVSWIMDVGLYEKEHADVLKRDADLVI